MALSRGVGAGAGGLMAFGEDFRHRCDDLRVICGHIGCFTEISLEVIEFPRLFISNVEALPLPDPDGLHVSELPVKVGVQFLFRRSILCM